VSTDFVTGASNTPNLGPYYASGAATTAQITGFTYPSRRWAYCQLIQGDGRIAGHHGDLADKRAGQTRNGCAAPSAGMPGATCANGIGNRDNSFNAASSVPAITDGGDCQLATVTSVPLPASLPLMFLGVGGFGGLTRRRKDTSMSS
jgi:hypothetical protein